MLFFFSNCMRRSFIICDDKSSKDLCFDEEEEAQPPLPLNHQPPLLDVLWLIYNYNNFFDKIGSVILMEDSLLDAYA